jgi:hypothetical protein
MKCFLFLTLLLFGHAGAAEVKVVGDQIVIGGMLVGQDFSKFQELLDSSNPITTVVFENSEGGSAAAAFDFARLIKQRSLNTVAKGKCYSACGFAFLAGKTRAFDKGPQLNGLMFHMARITRNGETVEAPNNDKMLSELNAMTGDKIPDSIGALIGRSWKEHDGLLIVSKNYYLFNRFYLFNREEVMYCDGTQKLDASRCAPLSGVNAHGLGVLTYP